VIDPRPYKIQLEQTNTQFQTASATVALANKQLDRGDLDFLDNEIDRRSGTLHARATLANPALFLGPGQFARVRLLVGSPAPVLLVPDAAILADQSQHLVLTVSPDGTVAPKQVEVGDIREGLRVIRSGLTASDRVVIDGLQYAAPGS
jgi:membrane fusion protein, multidrug efflux system